jgi:hypothetical protein
MSYDKLVKNGILLILLNDINDAKNGCFGVVFITTSKALVYFGRRSRVQLKRSHIEHKLFLLLMDGYKSITIMDNS